MMRLCLTDFKVRFRPITRLFVTLFLMQIALGCSLTTSKRLYENPEFGISLEKPANWSVQFHERNGSVILEGERGLWNEVSARIEIYGYACVPPPPEHPEDALRANIQRIGILYGLDEVKVTQDPTIIEATGVIARKAVIAIPTMSMPEDSQRNQMQGRAPNVSQTIELYMIEDANNHSIRVEFYPGESKELNSQAEEIVSSIRLTCP